MTPIQQPGTETAGASIEGADAADRPQNTWIRVQRYGGNPVLTAEDLPIPSSCVFNSGAVRMGGETIMLVNAWDREWAPRFLVAASSDGAHFSVRHEAPGFHVDDYPYVRHEGIFDTRITPLEGSYYITYNVASRLGGRIMLVNTDDFRDFRRMGFIAGPDHRNCAIFPERIRGDYVRLERPIVDGAGDIHISYSPDLIHWGRTELLLERNKRYWASAKIGPGAPPIRTGEGWLVLYHGAREGMNGYTYHGGCILLDLEDPRRIRGRLHAPILSPETIYERTGITPNVTFPVAGLLQDDGDTLFVYYGAADTSMCLATISQRELVQACLASDP